MTQASAIAKARILRGHLLAVGVKTVSIELLEGRGGSGWDKPTHVATLGHHIVSRRTQGNTPGLRLVKVGRPGIPGPLCNGYGGFDEVARIICMSWANHPGEGGPVEVEAGIIPANNGRAYLFGWEFEGGLNVADFTPSYRLFMARCHLGTLMYLRRTSLSHHEHKSWAVGRKVDRLGYSLAQARKEIEEAKEMSFSRDEEEWLKKLATRAEFLLGFAADMDRLDAQPDSMGHVLSTHRVVATKLGVSGIEHEAIALGLLGQ